MLFTSKRLWAASLSYSYYPHACLSFQQQAWISWSPLFFFKIGWPIVIWFDTDLSKTNHKGAGTRQLALPLARRGFWMKDFIFSPGQHLQNRGWNWHRRHLLAFGMLIAQSLNSECVRDEGVCICRHQGPWGSKAGHGRKHKHAVDHKQSYIPDIKNRRKFLLVGGPWKHWNSINTT